MSNRKSTAVDLLARDSQSKQSVRQRIQRRLEVLDAWLDNGVPNGKSVPETLTAARLWEDSELEIAAIASPNEFTTTHHLHGDGVRSIQRRLSELRSRLKRPSKDAAPKKEKVEKFDQAGFQRLLEISVSQWHAERDQRQQETKRADVAEARNELLRQECVQKENLIAELRRQLADRQGLRAVE